MIQILVDLANVPSGGYIRKLTGTTTYQVQRMVEFRDLAGKITQVKAETGAVFLLGMNGEDRTTRACSSDKRVVWLDPQRDVLKQMLLEEGLISRGVT